MRGIVLILSCSIEKREGVWGEESMTAATAVDIAIW